MDAKNFEVGQVWVTRGGEVKTIDYIDMRLNYPIRDKDGNGYTATGSYFSEGEDEKDLHCLKRTEGVALTAHTHQQADAVAASAPDVLAVSSDIATDRIELWPTDNHAHNIRAIIVEGMHQSIGLVDTEKFVNLYKQHAQK